jgi:hypothetical protein
VFEQVESALGGPAGKARIDWAGISLMTATISALVLAATWAGTTSRVQTSCYAALVGIGLGCLMQMVTTIAQNSVEMRDMGVGSASITLFRTIGGSVGVAIFGSLFTRSVEHSLPVTGSGGAAGTQPDGAALAKLPAAAKDAYLHSVATGTHQIFLLASIVCVVGFITALCVKEIPLRGRPQPQPQPAQDKPVMAASGSAG